MLKDLKKQAKDNKRIFMLRVYTWDGWSQWNIWDSIEAIRGFLDAIETKLLLSFPGADDELTILDDPTEAGHLYRLYGDDTEKGCIFISIKRIAGDEALFKVVAGYTHTELKACFHQLLTHLNARFTTDLEPLTESDASPQPKLTTDVPVPQDVVPDDEIRSPDALHLSNSKKVAAWRVGADRLRDYDEVAERILKGEPVCCVWSDWFMRYGRSGRFGSDKSARDAFRQQVSLRLPHDFILPRLSDDPCEHKGTLEKS